MIYPLLDTIGMLGVGVLFFGLIIGSIFLFRAVINGSSKKHITNGEGNSHVLVKKHTFADLAKYNMVFTMLGLSLSLGIVLTAFEYPDYEEQTLVDLGTLDAEIEETIEIPPTEQKPPPPPKIQQPEIVEVPDEEEIEEEIEVELDVEIDEETVVEEVIFEEEEEEEEEVDEIFQIVEDSAEPPGGMIEFLKWVGKNIKYPNQARRMGVEGKVYVQFVVDKDGTLTDIQVVRGIGAGCDEEAARIIGKSKKWKPGKQRGRAVKQRMILPINFKLG